MQRLEIPYHIIIIVDSCEIGILHLSLLDIDYTFMYKGEVQSPIICKYQILDHTLNISFVMET